MMVTREAMPAREAMRDNRGAGLDSVHHADIFDLCAQLEPASVDMILCDLPYGTTACSWDTVIPFAPMWAAFKRIVKPRAAIVLTASQPFTSALVMSNVEWFKYAWVWEKTRPTGHMHAKNKPLKIHEDVLIFSNGTTVHETQSDERMGYYPQMAKGDPYTYTYRTAGNRRYLHAPSKGNFEFIGKVNVNNGVRYPNSIIRFANSNHESEHGTQKPVALFAYLIRTYTRPGDLVVDPCVGSGTTALAARQEGRHYIVGDSSAEYVAVTEKRLAIPYTLPMLGLFAEEGA